MLAFMECIDISIHLREYGGVTTEGYSDSIIVEEHFVLLPISTNQHGSVPAPQTDYRILICSTASEWL